MPPTYARSRITASWTGSLRRTDILRRPAAVVVPAFAPWFESCREIRRRPRTRSTAIFAMLDRRLLTKDACLSVDQEPELTLLGLAPEPHERGNSPSVAR